MKEEKYLDEVRAAVKALKDGKIILYPTDTIWGLGCDACNPEAVSKIYEIKKRSDSKSLVLLARDLDMVARYIREIPYVAEQLVEVNDRPMTIVYPGAICSNPPEDGKKPICDKHLLAYNVVAEDKSVGIRIPDMDFCQDVLSRLGRPIVSTSANISGEEAPQVFDDIADEIKGAVDLCVDHELEAGSTMVASQIIKLGLGGEVEIIRK